jgi:hypothetical protein
MSLVRRVLALQGALYIVTGLWPLIHLASFELVTGPKTDDWLVRTVGVLLAVIGAVLAAAAAQPVVDRLLGMLAIGVALALAAVEVSYVASGTISAVYLVDAAIELVFAALLVFAAVRAASRGGPAPA